MKTNEPQKPNFAVTKEHLDKVVNQAEEFIRRAAIVNKAQYTHGINSSSATVEHYIRRARDGKITDYGVLDDMGRAVMRLGGYLYALQNNL